MDLKELRKLPMPKLRDVAKQETDLKNVVALEKEELIRLKHVTGYAVFYKQAEYSRAVETSKQIEARLENGRDRD